MEEIINDLDEWGFDSPKRKRGVLIWLLVVLTSAIIVLIYRQGDIKDRAEDRADRKIEAITRRYDSIIIRMVNDQRNKNYILDTLTK